MLQPLSTGINSSQSFLGCNKTLSAVNGTFQSPNYPREYPDGQYCSWRITVKTTQQIHLMFTNFSLQNENNTDALYVYDGEDSRRKILGVYYGGHPPPKEGIYSSSNRMLVIFKSDKNGSYTGFSASYYGVNISGRYCEHLQTHLCSMLSEESMVYSLLVLASYRSYVEPK